MSLGDRDRFQVQPHDSTLEQTADSQEKAAGDAALGDDLPKPPPPPRKKMIEPELFWFLLPVSLLAPRAMYARKSWIYDSDVCLSVAPEGESKCLHSGLPSKQLFEISSLLLLV
jgi:hypothetical protein